MYCSRKQELVREEPSSSRNLVAAFVECEGHQRESFPQIDGGEVLVPSSIPREKTSPRWGRGQLELALSEPAFNTERQSVQWRIRDCGGKAVSTASSL